MTEAELIARVVVQDDRAAFGTLLRRHQSAVRHFLRHLTHHDTALADDLAQETFIQAYANLGRFQGSSRFSTWLLGIAHNQYRNARRHGQRRQDITVPMPDHEMATPSNPDSRAASDLQHDLSAGLSRLPREQQTAIHLCYLQGLSHTEAAAVLACPLGTLKTNLLRAKEQLSNFLAAWNPRT